MITAIQNPISNGCSWYRITIPYTNENILIANQYLNVDELAKSDIIVFHKDSYSETIKKYFTAKIVIDVDDLIEVEKNHISYRSYIKNKTTEYFKSILNKADILTTTNERLQTYLINEFNKPVIIIPNTVDIKDEKFELPLDKLRIVYTGGNTHQSDIYGIRGIGNNITNNYELDVFYNNYKNILKGNVNVKSKIPINKFISIYNNYNICIAPLENNRFNYYKSNLKFIEAAFTRTLFIGQNIATYSEVIHNETGLLFNDKYELTELLNNLTANDIVRITNNAYNYVSENYNINTIRTNLKTKLNNIK